MRRTPLKRRSPTKRVIDKTRVPNRGYKTPAWFNEILLGSHGNTPAQKRYWKVVSDTYRRDDFERYDGRCVSCNKHLERWQDGHLAHFKAWRVCHSWFKYERLNVALSCPSCNRLDDGMVSYNFAKELQRRYGASIIEWIEKENEKYRGQKMENWQIVERVAKLRPDLVHD